MLFQTWAFLLGGHEPYVRTELWYRDEGLLSRCGSTALFWLSRIEHAAVWLNAASIVGLTLVGPAKAREMRDTTPFLMLALTVSPPVA